MNLLYNIFVDPFVQMGAAPDLLVQTLWEGLVSGVLYALIALGFVLIFKASGVFNFAQGIMVVFAALTLVGLHEKGVPALARARADHRRDVRARGRGRALVLRPLVNQPDIILFMATFGLTYFLIGLGELIFGGNPKLMIAERALSAAAAPIELEDARRLRVAPEDRHRRRGHRLGDGRGARGVLLRRPASGARCARSPTATRRRSRSASRSNQIWVIVWFAAGIVALVTGIMWGARSDVSFALQIIALKALPVLILGGFTSIPGAIVGGLIIGIGEKLGEFYWGPLVGGGIESWLAYVIALALPAVPAAGPVRREDHRADLRPHALPRGRPVQDELRRRHGGVPAPAGPHRHRRHPRSSPSSSSRSLGNDFLLNAVMIPFLVFSLAAIGLNILTGYTGLLSLGTGAFMGVGAYACYKLTTALPAA